MLIIVFSFRVTESGCWRGSEIIALFFETSKSLISVSGNMTCFELALKKKSHKKVIVRLRKWEPAKQRCRLFEWVCEWPSNNADSGSVACLYLFNILLGFNRASRRDPLLLNVTWGPAVSSRHRMLSLSSSVFCSRSAQGNKYQSVNDSVWHATWAL